MQSDSTERFTGRADYYAHSRPGYPDGILSLLKEEADLTSESVIVDVGSGTGISTALFLKNGNPVFAVEPNAEMRAVAEKALGSNPKFHSIGGKAEVTTLPSAYADFVVCAQSFHWFDTDASKAEFRRILKPGGAVVLMWNRRREDSSPFMAGYDAMLRQYGKDYEIRWQKQRSDLEGSVRRFFAPNPFYRWFFESSRETDLEGLKNGFLSASYAPLPGEPLYERAIQTLETLFGQFAEDGAVKFEYDAHIYLGHL